MPEGFFDVQRHHLPHLLLLVAIVPLQYLLTSQSSENLRQYHIKSVLTTLSDFQKTYLNPAEWRRWCTNVIGLYVFPDDYKIPDVVSEKADKDGYYAGSFEPRGPRSPGLKLRVGQVVRHKTFKYRGVIIGWDELPKAPESYLQNVHQSNTPHLREMPHYAVLIDTRDRFAPQMTYIPEETLEVISNTQIYHPYLEHHFEDFDGAQYIMRPWLRNVYPYD